MSNYKEALHYMEFDLEHNDFIRYKNGSEVDNYHRVVLKTIIARALPKMPVYENTTGVGANAMFAKVCPVCKEYLYVENGDPKFCHECGQALEQVVELKYE